MITQSDIRHPRERSRLDERKANMKQLFSEGDSQAGRQTPHMLTPGFARPLPPQNDIASVSINAPPHPPSLRKALKL